MIIIARVIIWLLLIGSVYVILYTKLGFGYGIYCDNADNINSVLENLSYSYIAGYIFYILTYTIPHNRRAKRLSISINQYFRDILGMLEESKKAVLTSEEYATKTLTDELFLTVITSKSLKEPCALNFLYNNCSIVAYLRLQKENIVGRIRNLYPYLEYMNDSQIEAIENLHNSNYFNCLKIAGMEASISLSNNPWYSIIQLMNKAKLDAYFDSEEFRCNLGNSLLHEIHNLKKITK